MKSINYGPLTGRKTTIVIRKQQTGEKKIKKQRILLIRDGGGGMESDNMQRDETMCVLDVGMKKERNQRLQPAAGSRAQELDHRCCGVSIFTPSSNLRP